MPDCTSHLLYCVKIHLQWTTYFLNITPVKSFKRLHNDVLLFTSGVLGTVLVRQKNRHIRWGGHVRAADGHHQEGVPHTYGNEQWTEPSLQRRALRLQKGRCWVRRAKTNVLHVFKCCLHCYESCDNLTVGGKGKGYRWEERSPWQWIEWLVLSLQQTEREGWRK